MNFPILSNTINKNYSLFEYRKSNRLSIERSKEGRKEKSPACYKNKLPAIYHRKVVLSHSLKSLILK